MLARDVVEHRPGRACQKGRDTLAAGCFRRTNRHVGDVARRSSAEDLERVGRDNGLAALALSELERIAEGDVAVGGDLAGRQGGGLSERGRGQARQCGEDHERAHHYNSHQATQPSRSLPTLGHSIVLTMIERHSETSMK